MFNSTQPTPQENMGMGSLLPILSFKKNHLNQGCFNLNNALGIPNGSALLPWGLGRLEYTFQCRGGGGFSGGFSIKSRELPNPPGIKEL